MKLFGYVLDKTGSAVPGAIVELKNDAFQTVLSARSDDRGYYEIEAEAQCYPFLTAVKSYAQAYLEYWCQNVDLTKDLALDARIDTLEVYGLHAFSVKGGRNALMVYFRPMSLDRFRAGEQDIAPLIRRIRAKLDGKQAEVLLSNPVRESIDNGELTAYLIQIANPNPDRHWKRVDIEIWDHNGSYGAATFFQK